VKTTPLALTGLMLAGAALAPARADLRYTSQMKMGGDAAQAKNAEVKDAAGPTMRTTYFYKDTNERQETEMDMMGMFQSKEVILTLCEKQQTITMDPALKIYTVAPIGGAPVAQAAAAPGKPAKAPATGPGKMVSTFTVKDLGTEKLQNLETRHSLVTTRIQTSGCLGESDSTFKYEVWTAPKSIKACPERYAATRTVAGPNGCSITYEVKGDAAAMQKAMAGMIVQQKFYMNDKVSMVQELRDWSEAALDASLFTVPADFKKVTQAEYDKAKADAMQKAMLRGITPPAGQAKAAEDASAEAGSPGKKGGNTLADEVADTVNDAANEAANDAKNDAKEQVKDEVRKKIKLPKIRF